MLLDDLFQHSLHVLQVIVFIPSDRTSRYLNAFADGVVDRFVGDDDVPALGKRRDHAGNGGESLSVDDARGHAQMGRNRGLGFHVYILSAVEARRTARPDAVGAQRLDGLLFQRLIRHQVVKVVGCEVRDRAPGGELRFGSGGSGNTIQSAGNVARGGSSPPPPPPHLQKFHPTITGRFSFSAASAAVWGGTKGSGVQSSTSSSIS